MKAISIDSPLAAIFIDSPLASFSQRRIDEIRGKDADGWKLLEELAKTPANRGVGLGPIAGPRAGSSSVSSVHNRAMSC